MIFMKRLFRIAGFLLLTAVLTGGAVTLTSCSEKTVVAQQTAIQRIQQRGLSPRPAQGRHPRPFQRKLLHQRHIPAPLPVLGYQYTSPRPKRQPRPRVKSPSSGERDPVVYCQ